MKTLALILLALSLSGCARCVESHYETRTREKCAYEMTPAFTSKGYQYVYINVCNGTEEYKVFVCTRYEDRP